MSLSITSYTKIRIIYSSSWIVSILYRASGFTPDPLPATSPVTASPTMPEPCAVSLWDWAPEPEPVCSGEWDLALSPSTWTAGLALVFSLSFDTAFRNASWMADSMSALRSFRAEVSGFAGASFDCPGVGRASLSTAWFAYKQHNGLNIKSL